MNDGQKVEAAFPGVKWTGSSYRHRSRASRVMFKDAHKGGGFLNTAHMADLPDILWTFLQTRFPSFNWLVTKDQFRLIIMTDLARHLIGQGDTKEKTKLRNPVTGNVFHLLASKDGLVGGIRIWLEPTKKGLGVGFRFRINAADPKENISTRIKLQLLDTQAEPIKTKVAPYVAEPQVEKVKAARLKVQMPK